MRIIDTPAELMPRSLPGARSRTRGRNCEEAFLDYALEHAAEVETDRQYIPVQWWHCMVAQIDSRPGVGTYEPVPAVQAFLDSPQFVDAKKRMGIVERLTALTPELRQRLSEAVSTNNQIAHSFGVPARLDCLLRKAD